MKKTITVLTLLLFVQIGNADAQTAARQIGLFGSLALPSGDFGENSGEDAGLAKTGFGIGIEAIIPIGQAGFSLMMTGSLLFNSMDEKTGDSFLASLSSVSGSDVDSELGRWMNIPVLAGLQYQSAISPTLDFFGFGLMGINFVKRPSIAISGSGEVRIFNPYSGYYYISGNFDAELESASANAFGFGFGGGLIINKKFTLSFRYLTLGEPEMDIKYEAIFTSTGLKVTETGEGETEQSISIIQLTFGIRL